MKRVVVGGAERAAFNRVSVAVKSPVVCAAVILAAYCSSAPAWQVSTASYWPVADAGVVTTQQNVTPAGVTSVMPGRVAGAVFDGENRAWVLSGNVVKVVDLNANRVWTGLELGGRPGWQGITLDPSTGTPLVVGVGPGLDSLGRAEPLRLVGWKGDGLAELVGEVGVVSAGGVAVARYAGHDGRRLGVIPLTSQNRLAVVDLAGGKKVAEIAVGQAPYGAVIDAAGAVAYVSNWGGRLASSGDRTAGRQSVVIDDRGVASTGSITKVDLARLEAVATIETELHPTAVVWDQRRQRLYVANSNSDSITVIDTTTDRPVQHWPIQPFESRKLGVNPSALALTRDGQTLFVACAGINAVAVVRTGEMRLQGLIPTAWYPISVGLDDAEEHLLVGSLLGAGSGDNGTKSQRRVQQVRGAVQVVAVPGPETLAGYSSAVAANSRSVLAAGERTMRSEGCEAGSPIPQCFESGGPIRKVVFVIKENRTYDQVFGDLGRGNGDPRLTLYGSKTTPNQRKMAREFALLDNFYATGIYSADGHQWLTQAISTSYSVWPGFQGRSYPFDGTDPIAYSSGGFLWDLAKKYGRTVQVFGEFAPARPDTAGQYNQLIGEWWAGQRGFRNRWRTASQVPGLDSALVRDFPAFTMAIPDVVRAEIFLSELGEWVARGEMPDLSIVQLPVNHTVATSPGWPTPAAMVADNDLALGMMVEALTKSPFWKEMAIFVVEDDAQDGVDHVDGHRTVAQVISPYTRRGHVDSTFYSHQSMLKTIELILGLAPMTLFDLIATDMRESFTSTPDFTPYEHVEPQVSLLEVNPPLGALGGQAKKDALASMKMNFAVPDEAPWDELNRILWRKARGVKAKYPGVREAAFLPLMVEEEDEDEKEK